MLFPLLDKDGVLGGQQIRSWEEVVLGSLLVLLFPFQLPLGPLQVLDQIIFPGEL